MSWKEKVNDVIVLILGGGRGTRLDPLTRHRSKPAVPIAGKYRLIDIPISNAINSGMQRMYVLTQFNSVSLHRHIGQTYRFDAFANGFVQILAAQQTPQDERWFQGTADAVRQNIDVLDELRGNHILILSGDHMYRMDYRALLKDHVEQDADITVGVLPSTTEEIADFGAVRVDDDGRIVEFREKPKTADERSGMEVPPEQLARHGVAADRPYLASMGIYLFTKEALIAVLENDQTDFGRHIIPSAVGSHRVQAHFYDGYWRDIGTIDAFFTAHMDLVRPQPPFDFYDPSWPFYTHPRFLPGARVDGCRFASSILAEGCTMADSVVERSIVGVRSSVCGATIRCSLIMGADTLRQRQLDGAPPVGIGPGTVIEHAIVDKNARIGRDVRIVNEDRRNAAEGDGWVIRDGIVVVEKNAIIPDGAVIG